jgi:hypothetical protein
MTGVQFPARQILEFFFHHRVQTDSGDHQVSYPIGTGGSFPGDKTAEAWSWSLTFEFKKAQSYTSTHLHDFMALDKSSYHGTWLSTGTTLHSQNSI